MTEEEAYNGPEKPCKFCASEDVKYFVINGWKRLRCFDCYKWLENDAVKTTKAFCGGKDDRWTTEDR